MTKKDEQASKLKDIAASLHVKRHTAGTSNEISLSVLDERRSRADEKQGSPLSAGVGTPSVISASGKKAKKQDAGTAVSIFPKGKRDRAARARKRALDNPEAEIRRRKKHRRLRRAVGIGVGVVALASVVTCGALYLVGTYEAWQGNLGILRQAMSELEAADEVVLAADEMAMSGLESAEEGDASVLRERIPDATVHINAARAFADDAEAALSSSDDKAAAAKVRESSDFRTTMLEHALVLIEVDEQAQSAVRALESGWESVLSADSLLRGAAALVAETTVENVDASQEALRQARSMLEDADASVEQAREAYPTADLSAISAYISARIEAIGYAVASNEAIYIQDKATADSQNALYNEAEAHAAKLARDLPENPAQPVLDALSADTAESREAYLNAREAAAASDAIIRDYLGIRGE